VFDMKAGVVMALFALRDLPPEGPPLRYLWVFDEEIGSPGSRALTEVLARESRAALVLEPSFAGQLKLARKGLAHFRLAAHGVAAHAGLDFERGANAIVELAAQLTEVARWSEPARGVTVNAGVVSGGTRANVVAAEASAELDVRAWTLPELTRVEAGLRALRPHDVGVRLEIEGGVSRPPLEPTAASEALARRAQAVAAELGFALGAARVGGASDGNFTAAVGCATLDGLGAVGDGAHSPGEFIEVRQLVPRTRLLAGLLEAVGRGDEQSGPPLPAAEARLPSDQRERRQPKVAEPLAEL
jgi:glutamate carboxypeptidase